MEKEKFRERKATKNLSRDWFSKCDQRDSKRDHITFVLSVIGVIDVSIKNLLKNLFLQTMMCHVTNSTKLKVLTNHVSMFALLVIKI